MADYNSSLPVRTQTNGDIVAQLCDSTTVSQKLSINAAGQALVLDGSDGSVAGGTAASYSSLVGGQYNTALPTLTALQQAALQLDSSGRLIIAPLTSGSTVTVNQGTSPWITQDVADGSVSGGTAGTFSQLAGGIYNSAPPTLTNGQQASLQFTASGQLITTASVVFPYDQNYGIVGANTLRTAAQIGNATGAADFNAGSSGAQTLRAAVNIYNNGTALDYNFGTVGANSLRIASQIGNSTGAADFNAGATSAQTLRVVANQGDANATPWNQNISQIAGAAPSASNALPVQVSLGSSFISSSNPLPVSVGVPVAGTARNYYITSVAVAVGATQTQSTTVAGATGFYLQQIYVSGSGKFKAVIQAETGVATNVFNILFVTFNSTATPYGLINVPNTPLVVTGARIQVLMTNNDLAAADLYSTVSGIEI